MSWAALAKGTGPVKAAAPAPAAAAATAPAVAANATPSVTATAAAPAATVKPAAPATVSAPAAAPPAAAASVPSPVTASAPSSSSPVLVAPAPVSVAAADGAAKRGAGKKKGPKGPNANAAPAAAAAAPGAPSAAPNSSPALLATSSSPIAVPSGGPSANPFHSGGAPHSHQQHAAAASSASSTPSNSNPGSPARKNRKKTGGNQHTQQQNGNGPHSHPPHGNAPHQQPSNFQPYAYPLQIGPNGLPLPMTLPLAGPALVGGAGGAPFLLPQGAGAGAPFMSGPGQQFPGAPMMPQFYAPPPQQPQPHTHHHHGSKRQQHHHNNNGGGNNGSNTGTFYPHLNNPNYAPYGASSSAASAPYQYSPQQQQQAQLAYQQMANMSLAAAAAAAPTLMYASASSAAAPNSIQGALPAFPVPFAMAPFAELLSSQALPSQAAPYFSVDVECIATGPGHNDRAIGHVAVVDAAGEVVLNVYIKPKGTVTSYLPALTGLSESLCAQGVTEEEAIAMFKACIPATAVLVGQNILKDVQWLQLEEGTDFASMLDLAGLFAVKHPKYKSLTFFSLAHEAKALLCLDQQEQHHPAIDALLSIRLYQLYTLLQLNPAEMERARALLLQQPVASAFNKSNPVYDGVCMGNRKECKCGSPWLG